jgi:hypothetical protein
MALMFHEDEPWNLGDSLTLASTVFYAIYILALEESTRRTLALASGPASASGPAGAFPMARAAGTAAWTAPRQYVARSRRRWPEPMFRPPIRIP